MSKCRADDLFGDDDADDTLIESVGNASKWQNEVSQRVVTDSPDHDLSQYEARATEERFRNMGYLEAFEEAKEVKLQSGFEEGYLASFNSAVAIGEALGEAATRLRVASDKNDVATNPDSKLTDLQEKAASMAQSVYEFLAKEESKDEASQDNSASDLLKLEQLLKEK